MIAGLSTTDLSSAADQQVLDVSTWTSLLGQLIAAVKSVSPTTKVGIAVDANLYRGHPGDTFDLQLMTAAASMAGVDFLGFDLYTDSAFTVTQQFLSQVGAGGKAIWINEAWSTTSPTTTNPDQESVDSQWADVLLDFARTIHAEGVSPFFTDYFASYAAAPITASACLAYYDGRTPVFQAFRSYEATTAAQANSAGYWMLGSDGAVYPFGSAPALGGPQLGSPGGYVALAPTPDGGGYWVVAPTGTVPAFGDAGIYPAPMLPPSPVVAIASTTDGSGYWLATRDGHVAAVGDAVDYGSPAGSGLHPAGSIVDLATAPDGKGYWLLGGDGGVFSYGDATFHGSTGGKVLNAPAVALASTADGHGYWFVAADGGVFSYGDAPFFGSMGGRPLNAAVGGIVVTSDGQGYWFVAADGGVFAFGDAGFVGSLGGQLLAAPVVAFSPA